MNKRKTNLLGFLVLAAATAVLFAQDQVPAPSASPGADNPGGKGISGTAQTSTGPTSVPLKDGGSHTYLPMTISGTVITNDGSQLPHAVSVIRQCAGSRRTLGYADSKGGFAFRLTNGGNMTGEGRLGDSSVANRFGGVGNNPMGANDPFSRQTTGLGTEHPFTGCEIEISASGFRSPAIDLSSRGIGDTPDLGTVIMYRIPDIDGTPVSATSNNAPKDAQEAFQRGRKFADKQKPDLAVAEFKKAIEIYPSYSIAWLSLGRLQSKLKDDAAAAASLRKAIDADPKLASPWGELGLVRLRQSDWPEAAEHLDRALHLNPIEMPALWFYDAVANFETTNLDVAEKSAREALKLDTTHSNPRCNQILGLILIQKKDLSGALDSFRSYLKYAKRAPDAVAVQKQIAELEAALAKSTR